MLIPSNVPDSALQVRNFPDFERWSEGADDVGRCIVMAPRVPVDDSFMLSLRQLGVAGHTSELDPRTHRGVASVVLDVEEAEWAWADQGGADLVDHFTSALQRLGRTSEVLTTPTYRNDGTRSRDILVICAAYGGRRHAGDVAALYAALAKPVNEFRAARTFEAPNRIASDCRRRLAELLAGAAGYEYADRISQSELGFRFDVDAIEPVGSLGFVRCTLRHPADRTAWAEFAVRSSGWWKHRILVRSHGLGLKPDARTPKGWPP